MEEPIKLSKQRLLLDDIRLCVRSWQPVVRKNWIIKFSVYRDYILLTFVSRYTGQTIIRQFRDEDLACEYINFILSKDPGDILV